MNLHRELAFRCARNSGVHLGTTGSTKAVSPVYLNAKNCHKRDQCCLWKNHFKKNHRRGKKLKEFAYNVLGSWVQWFMDNALVLFLWLNQWPLLCVTFSFFPFLTRHASHMSHRDCFRCLHSSNEKSGIFIHSFYNQIYRLVTINYTLSPVNPHARILKKTSF